VSAIIGVNTRASLEPRLENVEANDDRAASAAAVFTAVPAALSASSSTSSGVWVTEGRGRFAPAAPVGKSSELEAQLAVDAVDVARPKGLCGVVKPCAAAATKDGAATAARDFPNATVRCATLVAAEQAASTSA
jgi:hypothetical protein